MIKVVEGSVHVNTIAVIQRDDVIVLECDLREKRAELWGYGTGSVLVSTQQSAIPTKIRFDLPDGQWVSFAEVARYTLTICCYRAGAGRTCWRGGA